LTLSIIVMKTKK